LEEFNQRRLNFITLARCVQQRAIASGKYFKCLRHLRGSSVVQRKLKKISPNPTSEFKRSSSPKQFNAKNKAVTSVFIAQCTAQSSINPNTPVDVDITQAKRSQYKHQKHGLRTPTKFGAPLILKEPVAAPEATKFGQRSQLVRHQSKPSNLVLARKFSKIVSPKKAWAPTNPLGQAVVKNHHLRELGAIFYERVQTGKKPETVRRRMDPAITTY